MMNNEDRYKAALVQIDKMSFDTGRPDLLGLRIKEVIRRAFHPKEECPQCKGAGEVPQIRTPDCGDCVSFSSTGPWSGDCSEGRLINDETDAVCSDFKNRLPMETCPSCNGKSKQYEDEVSEDEIPVTVGTQHGFFKNIDLEDDEK